MDTKLAESQLIEEAARAEDATGNNGGRKQGKVNRITGGGKASLAQHAKQVEPTPEDPPTRPTQSDGSHFPSTFDLEHLQALVESLLPYQSEPASPRKSNASERPALPEHEIVVPDSQVEPPAATPSNAPMSPPMTSSIAIPASVPEKKRYKPGQRKTRKEVDTSNILVDPVVVDKAGNTIQGGTAPTPSLLRSAGKRRQPYVDSQTQAEESDSGAAKITLSREQELVASPCPDATPSRSSRKRKLHRKPTIFDPIEDIDLLDRPSERVGKKGRLLGSMEFRHDHDHSVVGRSQEEFRGIDQHKTTRSRQKTFSTYDVAIGRRRKAPNETVPDPSDVSINLDPVSDGNRDTSAQALEETPHTIEDAFPEVADMVQEIDNANGEYDDAIQEVAEMQQDSADQLQDLDDSHQEIPETQQTSGDASPVVEATPVKDRTPRDNGKARVNGLITNLSGSARSARGSNNKNRAAIEMYDWAVPVRKLGSSPVLLAEETSSSEDEMPHVSPLSTKARTKEPRTSRRSKTPGSFSTPDTRRSARRSRESTHSMALSPRSRESTTNNAITAADVALDTVRELHHPPDLRSEGDFTDDEEELIRRAIRDYQQRNNLDMHDLVYIIHFPSELPERPKALLRAEDNLEELEDRQESNDFWEDMEQIDLRRQHEEVKYHIRARYHAFTSGPWTDEEDDELQRLVEIHPDQWELLSHTIGDRSAIDIQNRWKDHPQAQALNGTGNMQIDGEASAEPEVEGDEVSLFVPEQPESMQGDDDESTSDEPIEVREGAAGPCATAPLLKAVPQEIVQSRRTRRDMSEHTPNRSASTVSDSIFREYKDSRANGIARDNDITTPSMIRLQWEYPIKQRRKLKQPALSKQSATPKVHFVMHEMQSGNFVVPKGTPKRKSIVAVDSSPADDQNVILTQTETESPQDAESKTFLFKVYDPESTRKPRKPKKSDESVVASNSEDNEISDQVSDTQTSILREREPQAGKKISKHRQSRKLDKHGLLPKVRTGVDPAVPSRLRTLSLSQMRPGDKFDLVEAIALGVPDHEEDINWHEVATKMKQQWSLRTLQTAFKELLDLVMDQGTLFDTVAELLVYFDRQYSHEELKDHYEPHEQKEDVNLNDVRRLKKDNGSSGANLLKAKSKKKRSASSASLASRKTSVKRRETGPAPATPKAFQSRKMITASDDE
ncbi:hypothetical protein EK21DRAFT_114378 [Setomelanomma holmii]|uniref:Myb-like domain-containing protein n=1 Tax=Setomelanomma holmii TaxID=210430 RepID=A0A9P4H5H1_9PLEO|nr:hypothetical protein EK21DRAFT_114378 [Setomelanomma holmii]